MNRRETRETDRWYEEGIERIGGRGQGRWGKERGARKSGAEARRGTAVVDFGEPPFIGFPEINTHNSFGTRSPCVTPSYAIIADINQSADEIINPGRYTAPTDPYNG